VCDETNGQPPVVQTLTASLGLISVAISSSVFRNRKTSKFLDTTSSIFEISPSIMEQATAFIPLMESPRISVGLSIVILLALWKVQAWVTLHRRRSRFKIDHGCEEPAKYPNKDPVLGLDLLLDNYQSMKGHAMLPKIVSRYRKVGAHTYSFILAGRYRLSTVEPENLKAMLSTKFTSFMLPPRRTAVLKQFMGESIFASNGPQWQHSRAIIRPHLTKDSFIDSEMSRFEKHFSRLLMSIPKDRSKVDLQPLFFSFTMDAAIEMLTGKDLKSEEQRALAKDDNIVELFDDAQRFLAFRALMPFGSMSAKEKHNIKRCHDWVDRCVHQAIQEHKLGKVDKAGEKRSFLQELVTETDDAVRIRSELIAVLIAGRDTTASTLSSLWFVLARSPDVVARLQAEVAGLDGERPGFTRLKQMTYVQHTIQECTLNYRCFDLAV
jgi:cytochrome P450